MNKYSNIFKVIFRKVPLTSFYLQKRLNTFSNRNSIIQSRKLQAMYPPPQQGYPHPHGGYPQNYSGGYAQDPQQPGGYGQPPPVGYGQQPGGYPYGYGQTVIVTQPQTVEQPRSRDKDRSTECCLLSLLVLVCCCCLMD